MFHIFRSSLNFVSKTFFLFTYNILFLLLYIRANLTKSLPNIFFLLYIFFSRFHNNNKYFKYLQYLFWLGVSCYSYHTNNKKVAYLKKWGATQMQRFDIFWEYKLLLICFIFRITNLVKEYLFFISFKVLLFLRVIMSL